MIDLGISQEHLMMSKQPRRYRPLPPGRGVPIDPAAYRHLVEEPEGVRGTVLFPSDVGGYSRLCNTLVENAVDIALGGVGPVRSWRGWIPELGRDDLLFAAGSLDDSIPLDQVVEAIREAMAFVGIVDGSSASRWRETTGRPIDRADAEPRPKPRRKRA